jgi:hypothetical protein
MEVFIYDKEGILNYDLISSIVKELIPGSTSIEIKVFKNDNNYLVHYNSDVIKLQITPKLFYVPVKFIPNELEENEIVEFYMHQVHPKCILKLRRRMKF